MWSSTGSQVREFQMPSQAWELVRQVNSHSSFSQQDLRSNQMFKLYVSCFVYLWAYNSTICGTLTWWTGFVSGTRSVLNGSIFGCAREAMATMWPLARWLFLIWLMAGRDKEIPHQHCKNSFTFSPSNGKVSMKLELHHRILVIVGS